MLVLFYDVATPIVYTDETRRQSGLGGTEATITRIAHALGEHHDVAVAQHCRDSDTESNGIRYVSLKTANRLSPDVVVLLRKREWLETVGRQFPRARLFFWMHNMPSKALFNHRPLFSRYGYEIIGVSRFHAGRIARRLQGAWHQRLRHPFSYRWPAIPVHALHNPIDDDLLPDGTPVRPNQMILASSPTKGLWLTLKAFEAIRKVFPEYQLKIATYSVWDKNQKLPENVHFMGSLPHRELVQHIRESFCMFYPQSVRCETFGLVYAEANAVGTPVLAHDFGAASEVLCDESQPIDANRTETIIERLTAWRHSRPVILARPEFRLHHVKQTWLDLLERGKLS